MKRGLFLIVLFSLILSFSVSAATLNVPGDYATIQAAIDAANNGDTINVSNGVYDERLVINKQLIVQGQGAGTIIQPTNVPSFGVYDVEIDANDTIIQDFSFDFNGISDMRGGTGDTGIVVCDLDEPPVRNVQILNNIIYTGDTDTSLETGKNCDVSGLLIQGNIFYGDEDNSGEGIYINPYSGTGKVIINDNKFYGNLFSAVSVETGKVDVINNIINSNKTKGNYGIRFVDFIGGQSYSNVLISNNNIQNVQRGIRIGTSSDVGSNLKARIESNILANNDVGIWVRYGADLENSVHYNGFVNNINYGIDNSLGERNVNATYNWWGDCTGPGFVGPGSGDNITINVSYIPWLGACINNKTQPSCVLATDNVTLRVNVTSNVCVGNVWFGVKVGSGSWNNYTYTNKIGTIYSFIINSNLLTGGQNVSWTVYADDCYNHTMQNGIKSFYVNRRTNLTVNPSSPDGLNNWYITEPEFTLTNDDASKLFYRWDADETFNYTIPFGLENIPNPLPIIAGILELNWWGDVCNETAQKEVFKVDLTNPVIKDLSPANNSVVINNNKPLISAYIDDVYGGNSGINLSSVKMKINGNIVDANVSVADSLDATASFLPSTDLPQGINIIYINATDNSGRYSEIEWQFSINFSAAFSLSVLSPENKTYSEKIILFNLITNNTVEKIEYIDYTDRIPRWKKLCSSCSSYNKTKSLRDGFHNASFKATDYYGASSMINVTFVIDSIKPKIKNIEPRSNSFSNGEEFLIKYTEENLKEITLYYGNSTQIEIKILTNCTSGKNQICITDADLSMFNGQRISYWFNVSDFIRNVSSVKKKINVDTTLPIVNVIAPQNGGSYDNSVPFKINASENVEMRYSIDDINFKLLCRNCMSYDRSKLFGVGNYSIIIKAEDKAGNLVSEEMNFTVT